MKPTIIPALIAIILSIITLCSSISHANDKKALIKSVAYSTSEIAVTKVNDIVKQSSNQISTLKTSTYNSLISASLLDIQSIRANYSKTKDFTKKNEIFELATRFNDKLQQVLAKLPFTDTPKKKNYAVSKDKSEDKNAINCKVKHK